MNDFYLIVTAHSYFCRILGFELSKVKYCNYTSKVCHGWPQLYCVSEQLIVARNYLLTYTLQSLHLSY